jgi:hypothetical protein
LQNEIQISTALISARRPVPACEDVRMNPHLEALSCALILALVGCNRPTIERQGPVDAGELDEGVPDAGAPDSGSPDAGHFHLKRDAGVPVVGLDAGFFCNGAPGFPGPPLLLAGERAEALAIGDFNGDGTPDLVVSSEFSHQLGGLAVYLGNGRGSFGAPLQVGGSGASHRAVAIGDVNGDSNLDLITDTSFGYSRGALEIRHGHGDGTFDPAIQIGDAGIWARGIVAGDVNGDGRLDLVTNDGAQISVRLGFGDGGFGPAISSSALSATELVLADFNGDGLPDLFGAGPGGQLFLGKGDGSFGYEMPFYAGGADAVAVGDLNGDGKLDVVVARLGASTISVGLGNGDGTFRTSLGMYAPGPVDVALGDLGHDGHLDLLVSFPRQGELGMYRGHGDGTFEPPTMVAPGSEARHLVTADLNGDGVLDAVAFGELNSCSRATITTLLGRGDGTFISEVVHPLGAHGIPLTADFDGDGRPDVAFIDDQHYGLSVFLGQADGGLSDAVASSAYSFGGAGAAGDFDGDGHPDIAWVGPAETVVYLGTGQGRFTARKFLVGSIDPVSVVVGDFNEDGTDDLLFSNRTGPSKLMFGNGDGSFAKPVDGPAASKMLKVADLNGDGHLDVVAGSGAILLGQGDGTFRPAPSLQITYTLDFVLGDFNGDGHVDLAALDSYSVSIFLGRGDGTFATPARSGFGDAFNGDHPRSLVLGDFNGDGHLDLAAQLDEPSKPIAHLALLLGHGDGTFAAPRVYPFPANAHAPWVLDLNGDGRPDLLVPHANGDVGVLLNQGCY